MDVSHQTQNNCMYCQGETGIDLQPLIMEKDQLLKTAVSFFVSFLSLSWESSYGRCADNEFLSNHVY